MDINPRIPFALVLLIAVMALAGCNSNRAKWIGTWEGFLSLKSHPENPNLDTVDKVQLIFNGNSTFNLYLRGIPVSGQAFFGSNETKLKVKTVMDRPIESQPTDIQAEYNSLLAIFISETEIELTGIHPNNQKLILKKDQDKK